MKFKKTIAAIAAAALALSMSSVSAFAFDFGSSPANEWTQKEFTTNESAEFAGKLDPTNVTKIRFKVKANDLNWGWNNGLLVVNSDLGWVSKNFGGTSCDVEYKINDAGETAVIDFDMSGNWFQISWGATTTVDNAFSLTSIEFYNGSELLGTWVDGTYTAGGSVKPGDDDDKPVIPDPVVPDVPVKTSVKAELYSWTGLAAGLDLSGNDLFNAVANAVFVKSDVKDLKLGIDYTYDITVSGNTAVVKLVVLNDDLVLTDDSVTSTVLKLYSNKTADDVIDDVVEDDDIPDASPFMALPAAGFSAAAGSTDTADTDNNSSIDGTAGKNVDFENVAAGAGMTDEAASDNFDAVAVGAVVAAALAAAATVVAAKKQRN